MCTAGLQHNDLLSGTKKGLLTKFSRNDGLLDEMADVPNTLFAGLPNWIWDAPESVPVSPPRFLNGKCGAMTDEDVLQPTFLHYIGITWSIRVKGIFRDFGGNDRVWKGAQSLSYEKTEKRRYLIGKEQAGGFAGAIWDVYK